MNNTLQLSGGVGTYPDPRSLMEIRTLVMSELENNRSLSPGQKVAVLKELSFYLKYEKMRRLRLAKYQWENEHSEEMYRRAKRHHDFVRQLAIERKETQLAVARMDREIVRLRIDTLQSLRRFRPEPAAERIAREHRERIAHIRMRGLQQREAERELASRLSARVMHRANFLRHVRENFPDMEEELMERYDRHIFDEGGIDDE